MDQDLALAQNKLDQVVTCVGDLLVQLKNAHPDMLSLIEKQPEEEQRIMNRRLYAVEAVHIRLMKRKWARYDEENIGAVLQAYKVILNEIPFAWKASDNAIKLVERLRTNWLEANTIALKTATENLKDCYEKEYPEVKLE